MKEYSTSSTIGAPAERVWAILTDAARYAQWNPEIVAVDGTFTHGGRVVAHVRLGDGAVRKVPQRVTLDSPFRMEWLGGLPLGLFVGRRTFTVKPVPGGAEFRMDLHMSGPLCSLILKSMGNRQPEIDSFSSALKQRAEGSPP
jgi:uncharacterized protein YndB with AHSA1/START domain